MTAWTLHDGPSDVPAWMRAAYGDQTLVTKVGPVHADLAEPGEQPIGRPTSSSTLPSLVLRMLRYGQIFDGADVLDVATGSGYSAAVLAQRLGDRHVASIDVDPYLTKVAAERLDSIGLRPRVQTVDATGPVLGDFDRIVAMVAVRPIPASWLIALRPGGRLVTTIADTALILTADKCEPGGEWAAIGRIERDWAMFMSTRTGADYPDRISAATLTAAREHDGERVWRGRFPVLNVPHAWELMSLLEITEPGIVHDYEESEDGVRTAWMMHADGSWARAEATGDEPPVVHESGPRRLWDALDRLRAEWLSTGYFQLYGARAFIAHDGAILLARGGWRATIA